MEKILQKKIVNMVLIYYFKKTQIGKDTFSCFFIWEWAKQISTEVEWVK
jgi:hypothetical protein